MPGIDRGNAYSVLSSDWSGLSDHLIARFYPVRRVGSGDAMHWEREPNSVEVRAPLTDGHIDQTINWHSPFENQTADAKLSSLSSLIQAGGLQSILNSVTGALGGDKSALGGIVNSANNRLASLMGRSAVTKLNSTQIFSGMPPLKITATAHFRAMMDANAEVRRPMDQLMSWAMPKKLSLQGFVGTAAETKTVGFDTLYPSDAPQIIAMQYADALFIPMVIESMPQPLTGSRDSGGQLLHSAITFTLGSLTALDKDDWAAVRRT